MKLVKFAASLNLLIIYLQASRNIFVNPIHSCVCLNNTTKSCNRFKYNFIKRESINLINLHIQMRINECTGHFTIMYLNLKSLMHKNIEKYKLNANTNVQTNINSGNEIGVKSLPKTNNKLLSIAATKSINFMMMNIHENLISILKNSLELCIANVKENEYIPYIFGLIVTLNNDINDIIFDNFHESKSPAFNHEFFAKIVFSDNLDIIKNLKYEYIMWKYTKGTYNNRRDVMINKKSFIRDNHKFILNIVNKKIIKKYAWEKYFENKKIYKTYVNLKYFHKEVLHNIIMAYAFNKWINEWTNIIKRELEKCQNANYILNDITEEETIFSSYHKKHLNKKIKDKNMVKSLDNSVDDNGSKNILDYYNSNFDNNSKHILDYYNCNEVKLHGMEAFIIYKNNVLKYLKLILKLTVKKENINEITNYDNIYKYNIMNDFFILYKKLHI